MPNNDSVGETRFGHDSPEFSVEAADVQKWLARAHAPPSIVELLHPLIAAATSGETTYCYSVGDGMIAPAQSTTATQQQSLGRAG